MAPKWPGSFSGIGLTDTGLDLIAVGDGGSVDHVLYAGGGGGEPFDVVGEAGGELLIWCTGRG